MFVKITFLGGKFCFLDVDMKDIICSFAIHSLHQNPHLEYCLTSSEYSQSPIARILNLGYGYFLKQYITPCMSWISNYSSPNIKFVDLKHKLFLFFIVKQTETQVLARG